MKRIHNLAILSAIFLLCSCSDMDDYKKIMGEDEILYSGKIEEVVVRPGMDRLEITGVYRSDPKIVNCRIYWNLRKDSVDVPVDMTGGPFTVRRILDLPEQTYNFDIFTYDADGNRSIPVNVTGKSYGDKYQASLSNRLIRSFTLSGADAVIEWREIDTTTGAFATEVVYTDTSDRQIVLTVPVAETTTTLENYKPLSEVTYTTIYLPDELALDLFRSASNTIGN